MCLGVPGRVIEVVDPANFIAHVDLAGVTRVVNIGLLPDDEAAGPGDYVLVHIGYALNKISEQEAIEIEGLLSGIGEENVAELERGQEMAPSGEAV